MFRDPGKGADHPQRLAYFGHCFGYRPEEARKEMIGMSTILSIRRRCAAGDSVAEIAREEGVSEPTVRKYRDMDDLSPRAAKPRKARSSKLDPYKGIIDSWLADDRRRRAKQRHTATRIFERLVAEFGYDGGYTTVQKYVKERKSQARSAKRQFLNLEWAPAEAQVDFGVCDFRVLGVAREVHYLVVTFPFSNVSLAQCFWGETSECVCEGLKAVFEFCGGVPLRLVFDNATGVGRRVGDAVRTADTFERFAAHYGFEFTFCNPASGNEKGSVENAVGAIRRNLFVPMPRVDGLRPYNKRLLGKCLARADKPHYLKGELESRLFIEDVAAMAELPAKPFRAVSVGSAKTDKYGDAVIDGRHRYPLGPERGLQRVIVELGAFEASFYDADGSPIATFDRAYGDAPTRASDPMSQLALLCRKPGGWRNSAVRAALPEPLSRAMDAMDGADRRSMLRMMRDVSAVSGFEAAAGAMAALSGEGVPSEADVAVAAALVADGQGAISYDDAPDLGMYDAVFARGA